MILALLIAAATVPPEEVRVQPQAIGADPRSQRPWVISLEAGWNGLAGLGLTVARHLDPHLTIEAGLGVSAVGAKVGVRGRYGFTIAEWSPFLGVGFLYGTGGQQLNGAGVTWRLGPSPFLQLTAGLEYQSALGFNVLCAAGYARLLQDNLTWSGSPTAGDLAAQRIATGSGPVISLSLGRAF